MDCCKKHGLPLKCLEQKLEANTESDHNNTHMVITTIISKECHDYKSVLQDCKKECINPGVPNKILISNQPDGAHNVDPNARGGDSQGEIDPLPRDEGKNHESTGETFIFLLK